MTELKIKSCIKCGDCDTIVLRLVDGLRGKDGKRYFEPSIADKKYIDCDCYEYTFDYDPELVLENPNQLLKACEVEVCCLNRCSTDYIIQLFGDGQVSNQEGNILEASEEDGKPYLNCQTVNNCIISIDLESQVAGVLPTENGGFGTSISADGNAIVSNTSDGSDIGMLELRGGGAGGVRKERGGNILLFGNDHASEPGHVYIDAGSAVGSEVVIRQNGNEKLVVDSTKITSNVDFLVPDEAYSNTWNNNLEVPTKNAIYDAFPKIEAQNIDNAIIPIAASAVQFLPVFETVTVEAGEKVLITITGTTSHSDIDVSSVVRVNRGAGQTLSYEYTWRHWRSNTSGKDVPFCVQAIDTPPAGTYDYGLSARTPSGTMYIDLRSISVIKIKN